MVNRLYRIATTSATWQRTFARIFGAVDGIPFDLMIGIFRRNTINLEVKANYVTGACARLSLYQKGGELFVYFSCDWIGPNYVYIQSYSGVNLVSENADVSSYTKIEI